MIFTHPQAVITFKHGPRPSAGGRSYDCSIMQSAAGMVISNTYRGAFTVWSLSWKNMPLVDRTDLEAFFIHTRGIADTFTWTWSDGTVKTVRFKTSALDFEESGGAFNVSVELME
jgi:hypothetical protein